MNLIRAKKISRSFFSFFRLWESSLSEQVGLIPFIKSGDRMTMTFILLLGGFPATFFIFSSILLFVEINSRAKGYYDL
jgi:hypothetical protein